MENFEQQSGQLNEALKKYRDEQLRLLENYVKDLKFTNDKLLKTEKNDFLLKKINDALGSIERTKKEATEELEKEMKRIAEKRKIAESDHARKLADIEEEFYKKSFERVIRSSQRLWGSFIEELKQQIEK